MAAVPDAVIEGVSGAIGAVIALTATYPLLTVSTLRALELREDGTGQKRLQGKLRLLPGPVQDVVEVGVAPMAVNASCIEPVCSARSI